jgi:hypothetical protein
MLYQWIISLPMMICLFWFIFFAVRAARGTRKSDSFEPLFP